MNYDRDSAQAFLDDVVGQMVAAHHPVEATNKQDHRHDYIPADAYAWSEKHYAEGLAQALVGGWWNKGALCALVKILIAKLLAADPTELRRERDSYKLAMEEAIETSVKLTSVMDVVRDDHVAKLESELESLRAGAEAWKPMTRALEDSNARLTAERDAALAALGAVEKMIAELRAVSQSTLGLVQEIRAEYAVFQQLAREAKPAEGGAGA